MRFRKGKADFNEIYIGKNIGDKEQYLLWMLTLRGISPFWYIGIIEFRYILQINLQDCLRTASRHTVARRQINMELTPFR